MKLLKSCVTLSLTTVLNTSVTLLEGSQHNIAYADGFGSPAIQYSITNSKLNPGNNPYICFNKIKFIKTDVNQKKLIFLQTTFNLECLNNLTSFKNAIKTSEGQVKNTSFQQVYITNLKGFFINGGYRVKGDFKVKVRELIFKNPITGKKHYSPWANITGNFTQDFSIAVVNGYLKLSSDKTKISLNKSLLTKFIPIGEKEIYNFIANRIKSGFKDTINEKLKEVNGVNLARYILNNGGYSEIQKRIPGISQNLAILLLKKAVDKSTIIVNYPELVIYLKIVG